MKFSEDQAVELMQYVTGKRTVEYSNLKKHVREDMKIRGAMSAVETDVYLFGDSMLRIGRINGLYSLLYTGGVINWDDYMELQDEVYEKFDLESIREEIRNQGSLANE